MLKKFLIFFSVIIIISSLIIYKNYIGTVYNIINSTKSRFLYSLGLAETGQHFLNSNPSDTFHLRSVNSEIPLEEIIKNKAIKSNSNYDIYVDLSTRTLHFRYKNETLKQYRIAAGSRTNQGDKEKQGDYRTPQGNFYVCSKEVYSPTRKYIGSRWMLLSYPNIEAAERGLKNNLINQEILNRIKKSIEKGSTPPQDTVLGNAVGIHGGAEPSLSKDWTAGCIGMYDQDVEEIYKYIKIGTKVVIK